jgi:hypothetical protein
VTPTPPEHLLSLFDLVSREVRDVADAIRHHRERSGTTTPSTSGDVRPVSSGASIAATTTASSSRAASWCGCRRHRRCGGLVSRVQAPGTRRQAEGPRRVQRHHRLGAPFALPRPEWEPKSDRYGTLLSRTVPQAAALRHEPTLARRDGTRWCARASGAARSATAMPSTTSSAATCSTTTARTSRRRRLRPSR